MKFCKNIMAESVAWVVALAATTLAVLAGCSSDSHVAGNSAETGSPELAGILHLDGGKPAARARVQCVPQGFDVMAGDALPSAFVTETDANGHYRLDSVPDGTYALEAYHPESGERLLVQGINVVEDDLVTVDDTLRAPGVLKFELEDSYNEHKVVATVKGTTIRRETTLRNYHEFIFDSLPAGKLDLQIYFDDYYWKSVLEIEVAPGDTQTLMMPSVIDPDVIIPYDSVSVTLVAPLALPEGVDSLNSVLTNIPIALRLTEEDNSFDSLGYLNGRWEAVRISKDGTRSKKLPIAYDYVFHLEPKKIVFWINVDSLNVSDSLELSYDGSQNPVYARDIFPTNRSYKLVWHFGNPLSPMGDHSEYGYFYGRSSLSLDLDAMQDGVLGGGVMMDSSDFFYVKNSAEPDSVYKVSLLFDGDEYFCFSVWVQLESLEQEQVIFQKEKEYDLRYDPAKGFVVDLWVSDSVNYKYAWASGTSNIKADEWVYVAFSYHKNSQTVFYVNDNKIEPEPEQIAWGGVRDLMDFRVGGFTGKIDELMLGGCYRDDSWTRLTYLNQKPVDFWPTFIK